ncbi:MAG: hypothetical protein IPJ32_19790 [Sphingobacteriaceae bacterium]|nr:hypothetical protein [Sphingobacteriaceae bacterium]
MKKLKDYIGQTKEELEEKRTTRKAIIVVVLCLAIAVPLFFFAREYFAKESLISRAHITLNSKERILIFSEKSSSTRTKDHFGERQSSNLHYGYYLELVDSLTKTSLSKLKFSSPVSTIQATPEMIINANNDVWLVSITHSNRRDEPGFILKFLVVGDTIIDTGFKLDEKYWITDIRDNRVFLGEGSGVDRMAHYDPIYGNVYLDLETGRIEDNRRTNEELSKH